MCISGPPQGAQAPLGVEDVAAVNLQRSKPIKTVRTKVQRHPVHGVLLLDKPLGLSSNQALQKVKYLLRAEKAGHTGTLDPLATGVLPLCFGAATKFSQMHLDAEKSYEAVAILGVTTTTGDAEGAVLEQRPVVVTQQDIARAQQAFSGVIQQTPPMYSALKKDGKALYEYARAGVEVERQPRQVTIYALELSEQTGHTGPRTLTIKVRCSKGTYIRTLAEDIGHFLGCGAHLSALRRTQSGAFTESQTVTIAGLESMSDSQRLTQLRPIEVLLGEHQRVELTDQEAGRFSSGLRRRGSWPDHPNVMVYGQNPPCFLGTAHIKEGELIPSRLLSPLEIDSLIHIAQEKSI